MNPFEYFLQYKATQLLKEAYMSLVTKQALSGSLKKLLTEKTLDKITISEICGNCGLNRQSFYYHFSNIYDLVSWTLKTDVSEQIEGKINYNGWQEGFKEVLTFCKNNKIIIYNLYHSQGKGTLEEGLKEFVINLLLKVIDDQIERFDVTVSDENREFIAIYNMYAFVGIVMLWIDKGMEEEPSVLIKRVHTLIEGDFKKAFLSFSNE
jgi:probable dihydroxyacetone kinase regulator